MWCGGDEGDEELPREMYDPPEEPMQIKMEWCLINKGERENMVET
jgi:hypothetical protein